MGSWTFRLFLLVVASAMGLWLGAGSRTVAAGKPAARRADVGKPLIADAFRFDILLARAEPARKPVVPAATPAVTIVACNEPIATAEVPLRVALELRGPGQLRIRPVMKPRKGPRMHQMVALQIRLDGPAAQLAPTEKHVQEFLRGLPGLIKVQRELLQQKLQCELVRASAAAQALTRDERIPVPELDGTFEFPAERTVVTAPPGCEY
jgi:hypothetical protein